MATTPWMTSDQIIASVKRKIAVPISQNLFSEDDLLAFANEEMLVAQVPSVLQWHEEYYVYAEEIQLESGRNRYPIPSRAIGMRLRDVMWKDQTGNLFEMTRIDASDKAFYQQNVGANTAIHKFYLENNDVVLTPVTVANPNGSLVFYFFLRPNTLVRDSRAAIISSFHKTITVTNGSLSAGDTVIIGGVTFEAVSGAPSGNQFQIGGSSDITASNLKNAIQSNGIMSASVTINVVTLTYTDIKKEVSSLSAGLSVQSGITVECSSTIPTNITSGSVVDILQTKPGHKILTYDISAGTVSGSQITFSANDIPEETLVGDYICTQYECIIPQLPTDLHSGLAERTSARILAAMGDREGLAVANQKIGEISLKEGTLMDARVEGAPKKVNARHSILRYQKMGTKRRF